MDVEAGDDALLLPEGACLVHVTPCTMTATALQGASWLHRDAVRARGVLRAERRQVLATWIDLATEAGAARARRVVLGGELLAGAGPKAINRMVHDLDPGRVHIVVTLRPLARILPSEWQEDIRAGGVAPYREWLDTLFSPAPDRPAALFWHRQRHDALIARWAEVVGPGRVTAVVVDERDHGMVLRVFERMTGLRAGTLVAVRDLANRSMTLPEIEAIRALNEAFRAEGLSPALQAMVVRYGAAAHMKTRVPAPDETRIETPRWALERAGEIATEMVAGIAASGVRVIGDLTSLAVVPPGGLAEGETQDCRITPEIAASLAMGVLLASGLARRGARATARDPRRDRAAQAAMSWPGSEPPELARVSSAQLIDVLAARTRAATVRALSAVGRRGLRGTTT